MEPCNHLTEPQQTPCKVPAGTPWPGDTWPQAHWPPGRPRDGRVRDRVTASPCLCGCISVSTCLRRSSRFVSGDPSRPFSGAPCAHPPCVLPGGPSALPQSKAAVPTVPRPWARLGPRRGAQLSGHGQPASVLPRRGSESGHKSLGAHFLNSARG